MAVQFTLLFVLSKVIKANNIRVVDTVHKSFSKRVFRDAGLVTVVDST